MHPFTKRLLRPFREGLYRAMGVFDDAFLARDVPVSERLRHSEWQNYLYELGNRGGTRVLEVGSREVSGPSIARSRLASADYIGFDLYDGPNVDVAGDAHRLSQYFPPQHFDIVYSSACFEHFSMPWVVAHEIAKVLKVGGIAFVETHFCFSSHQRPWHFFHFTDAGLRALFSEAVGFECIESGMSDPLVGRFSRYASPYLRYRDVPRMYCFSQYLGRKTKNIDHIDWGAVPPSAVVGDTLYPPAEHG